MDLSNSLYKRDQNEPNSSKNNQSGEVSIEDIPQAATETTTESKLDLFCFLDLKIDMETNRNYKQYGDFGSASAVQINGISRFLLHMWPIVS